MKIATQLRLSAGSLTVAVALVATPAIAQDSAQDEVAEQGKAIIVTGSRIGNPNLELSSPVSFIGEDEINNRQPSSIEELLRELPSAVPSIGPGTNNGSDGSARLNLRGLGTNRNLVLLNGRRVVPRGVDNVTDLNIIPVALIQRADVLTGGASTVYGADAIAGVVNFITRKNFEGFDGRITNGISEEGDGRSLRIDGTIGANFADGRGNAVLSLNYTETRPVLQGNRPIGLTSLSSNSGLPQGSPTAAPASIGSPFVGAVTADGQGFTVGPQNNFNFNPLNLFQTPLERYSMFGQANYEISSAVEVYSEAMFVKTIVESNLAPAGVFGSAIQVPLNNQFLSAQQASTLCTAAIGAPGGLPVGADCAAAIAAGTPVTVGVLRRFTEAGPRVQKFNTNSFQFTAGARGPLTDTLNWDISGSYGESDRVTTRTGWGLLSRVRSGVAGCPAGSAPGCVPFNLFGADGSITPDMLGFIDVPTFSFVDVAFTTAQASINGDLGFSSPLASTPIGVAVGLEYRKYDTASFGDAVSQIPGEVLGAGAAALPIFGEFDSNEAFAEVVVPLIEDRPFFHNLTVEGGVRVADYSTSGSSWTWKAGGTWAPVPDFKFRGVYSRAERAPNIGELFQPRVTALTGRATDPCQGTLAQIDARGSNFQTLCLAQFALVGVPASLLGTVPAPAAGQIQSTQGGNPDLDPETARSITFGAVATPSFLPGFSISIDYFRIRVTDAITTPSQSDVIDGCFQATPLQDLCTQIFRNPLTGSLSGPAESTFGPVLALSNLGKIRTNGFDLAANAVRDFDFGRLALSVNATWTQDFLFQATPLSINRQCAGFFSVSCGNPQPKFNSNSRLTYSKDGSSLSLQWRHLSSVSVEPLAPTPQLPVGTPTNAGPANIFPAFQKIGAYDIFDLAARQSIMDNLTLSLTVSNLFDTDPPLVGNNIGTSGTNSGNTFPNVFDTIGRRYTLGVQLTF